LLKGVGFGNEGVGLVRILVRRSSGGRNAVRL
jgi:hypothetical protein